MHWFDRTRQRCKADIRLSAIVLLSIVGCIGILPFAALRIARGEWLQAATDLALVFAFVGTTLWSLRTGRTTAASLMVLATSATALATVMISGLSGVFWILATLNANFMLAAPWVAVVCAIVMLAATVLLEGVMATPELPSSFLATGALMTLFAFVASSLARHQQNRLETLATRDALTGMGNRRTMELELEVIVAEHRAARLEAGIAVLDLDHFKRINDQHGHAAGDRVLVDFSRIVQGCIRLRDRLYRMGGEEFVLVLPQTDAAGVQVALAKVQAELRQRLRSPCGAVGTSMGAALLAPGEDWRHWLARADAALYCAKHGGRDRIELDHSCAADRRSGTPQYARA